jgi:hypothetical protein
MQLFRSPLTGKPRSLRSPLPARKMLPKIIKISIKKTLIPQDALRTHRPLVMMWACTRILALRERQTRREAGAQSLRAS